MTSSGPYDRYSESLPGQTKSTTEQHPSRSPVARDRDRIIHSGAFRRLQRKSQIVGVQANDFFRTRLTHTIECAQIGRSIAARIADTDTERVLEVVEDPAHFGDLIEAACLAHDLGHPPFGHNGEKALQEAVQNRTYKPKLVGEADPPQSRDNRSFEGNAQSFRIVTVLEPHMPVDIGDGAFKWCGMDLTRTTLKAMLKYPWLETARREPHARGKFCIYSGGDEQQVFEWLFEGDEPRRTLATEILEAADDIAYAVHDFEDGVWGMMIPFSRIVDPDDDRHERLLAAVKREWPEEFEGINDIRPLIKELFAGVMDRPWAMRQFDRSKLSRAQLKQLTSSLINRFVEDVTPEDTFKKPEGRVEQLLLTLTGMARVWMIDETSLETTRYGQRKLVTELFDGYWHEPKMLTMREQWRHLVKERPKTIEERTAPDEHATAEELEWWRQKARLVCDQVGGMTDLYALHMHAEMYGGGGAPLLRTY